MAASQVETVQPIFGQMDRGDDQADGIRVMRETVAPGAFQCHLTVDDRESGSPDCQGIEAYPIGF